MMKFESQDLMAKVLVLRPDGWGLGLGLEFFRRCW